MENVPTLSKGRVKFNCDFCHQVSNTKKVQYLRKKNHFCSVECYALFRRNAKLQKVTEEWADPKDFDKDLIMPDPFEMFNKGKAT